MTLQQESKEPAPPKESSSRVVLDLDHDLAARLLKRLEPAEVKQRLSLDDLAKLVQVLVTVVGAVVATWLFFKFDTPERRAQAENQRLQLERARLEVSRQQSKRIEPERSIRISPFGPDTFAVSFGLTVTNRSEVPVTVTRNVVNVYLGTTRLTADAGRVQPIEKPPGLASTVDWGLKPAYRADYIGSKHQGGNTGRLQPNESTSWTYDYVVRASAGEWLAVRADLEMVETGDGSIAHSKNETVLEYCNLGAKNVWNCDEKPERSK